MSRPEKVLIFSEDFLFLEKEFFERKIFVQNVSLELLARTCSGQQQKTSTPHCQQFLPFGFCFVLTKISISKF